MQPSSRPSNEDPRVIIPRCPRKAPHDPLTRNHQTVSTKTMWSDRSFRGGPPPVCIRRPPLLPPLDPDDPGYRLHCFARWTDLDPDASVDQCAMITLRRTMPPLHWFHGCNPLVGNRLCVRARAVAGNYWEVRLAVWDFWRHPEYYTWVCGPFPDIQNIDSGLMRDIVTPLVDYRYAKLMN